MSEWVKLKVLIIEDESIVAMMIEDLIVDMGHEVVGIAGRLEQAQRLAEELAVDFAIVDVNLNGQHTYPVAETLKARGVPFVFATGYGNTERPERFAVVPTITKPYGMAELRQALEALSA